jgi:hypothetical protein
MILVLTALPHYNSVVGAGLVCTAGFDGHIKGWDARQGGLGNPLIPVFDVNARETAPMQFIGAMVSLESLGQPDAMLSGEPATHLMRAELRQICVFLDAKTPLHMLWPLAWNSCMSFFTASATRKPEASGKQVLMRVLVYNCSFFINRTVWLQLSCYL